MQIARALSGSGGWMQTVAAGWLVYQLTGQAAQVGILAAVTKAPGLIGAPVGGWLADRMDRRRLAIILTVAQIVPAALLAVLSFDGSITPIEIYVLAFLGAVPAGLQSPVLSEITPDLVPEAVRKDAIATASATFNIARLAGPAIGGGLVAALGVAAAFAVNAVSYVAVVIALVLIPASSIRGPGLTRSAPAGVTEGFRVSAKSVVLRTLLAGALTFFVFVGPLEHIMPVIATDHGEGAEYVGLLLASIAVGALLGNPLIRRLQQRGVPELRLLGIGLLAAGALLILLALSKALVTDFLIIMAIGAVWEIIWVTESTTIHFRSPEGVSGQVMGLLFMIVSVSVALGSIAAGWAFDLFGPDPALIGSGAFLVAAAAFELRRVARPAPVPDPR